MTFHGEVRASILTWNFSGKIGAAASLRLGHITLLGEAFDHSKLSYTDP